MRDAGDALEMFAVGAIVGAGMMYLMDPKLGRSRRKYLRDKVIHTIDAGRRETDRFLRDKRNRAQGLLHELRGEIDHFRETLPGAAQKAAGQQTWP